MIDNNMDFVQEFENKLVEYTGFKYAVCVDCCTNGIVLALDAQRRLRGTEQDRKEINITRYTYLSVPMTLKNYGYKVTLIDDRWNRFYQIGETGIFDAAVDFRQNMRESYGGDSIACVSFQQKKRLALGRGGAILFDNVEYLDILRRLRYDGRDPYISDRIEINAAPCCIIRGYHCYMEPDKAARGILLLNQPQLLLPYVERSWRDYSDVSKLDIWHS